MKKMKACSLPLALFAACLGLGVAGQVLAADAASKREAAQKIVERFKEADTDGDGALTRAEADGKLPFVHDNFDKIDTAGSGKVTLKDLRSYLAAQKEARQAGAN